MSDRPRKDGQRKTEAEIEEERRFTHEKFDALDRLAEMVDGPEFKLAYIIASDHLNKDTGEAFPERKTLARKMNRSISQIDRLSGKLAKTGQLHWNRGHDGRSNRYWFEGVRGIKEPAHVGNKSTTDDGTHDAKMRRVSGAARRINASRHDAKMRRHTTQKCVPNPLSEPFIDNPVSKKESKQAAKSAADSDSKDFCRTDTPDRNLESSVPDHPGSPESESGDLPDFCWRGPGRPPAAEIPAEPSRPPLPDLGAPLSTEEMFWSLVPEAEAKGVERHQIQKLLQVTENFDKAMRVLKGALKARRPSGYLHNAIEGIEGERAAYTAPVAVKPSSEAEPEFVVEARREGQPVRKDTLSDGSPGWWIHGLLYNSAGVDVGG